MSRTPPVPAPPSPGPRRAAVSLAAWGVLAWLLLAVVWLTWAPFEFGAATNRVRLFPHTGIVDLGGNLALLMPVGAVAALLAERRPVHRALLAGLLISAGLELGQMALPGRIASLTDLALNATGAAVGAGAALRLRARYGRVRVLAALVSAVYAALLAYTLRADLLLRRGMRLEGWDPRFEVAVADEVGGGRRYLGRVWDARLCAGAGPGRVCVAEGASEAERARLVRAAERSQEVELHARVLSATDAQAGPTRILTFSRGPYQRNLTLGQEGTALVIRVRTPLMGENGMRYEIRIPGAVRAGVPTRVLSRYRAGTLRTEVAGADGAAVSTHAFDGLGGGILLGAAGPVSPVEMGATRWLCALLLTLPLLGLAALRLRRAARPGG